MGKLQQPHAVLEFVAVCGVLVDLPGPEQFVADLQAGFADLFLEAAALGVRCEGALQV